MLTFEERAKAAGVESAAEMEAYANRCAELQDWLRRSLYLMAGDDPSVGISAVSSVLVNMLRDGRMATHDRADLVTMVREITEMLTIVRDAPLDELEARLLMTADMVDRKLVPTVARA
jgi:hypothetical protein